LIEKKLISVLNGKSQAVPPIWLMRQAGRYLPEYRALRAKAGSFWTMCMDPAMATEITLQPIRRFAFDAAIIFSDILTVPYALGRRVTFTEGEGPSLVPVDSVAGLERDADIWREKLSPAYETLRQVRAELDWSTTLLGFAGAPWTLATYMAAGRGGDEQQAAKQWARRDRDGFGALLELLGDCVAQHLVAQLDAGADAVQIFDSWAGGLSDDEFDDWVIAPTARITAAVRRQKPDARIIGFPRAMQPGKAQAFLDATEVNAISVDTRTPLTAMAVGNAALQGNLDPEVLVRGGDEMRRAAENILDAMRGRRFVFNLGHGVVPQTPVAHVEELVKLVRGAA
jgi:uroporphyrinogen decarboxylase